MGLFNFFKSKDSSDQKKKIAKLVEERLNKVVAEHHKKSPLAGSPLEGMAMLNAINGYSEGYKKEFISKKEILGLEESEIMALVDNAKEKVVSKFIEF